MCVRAKCLYTHPGTLKQGTKASLYQMIHLSTHLLTNLLHGVACRQRLGEQSSGVREQLIR